MAWVEELPSDTLFLFFFKLLQPTLVWKKISRHNLLACSLWSQIHQSKTGPGPLSKWNLFSESKREVKIMFTASLTPIFISEQKFLLCSLHSSLTSIHWSKLGVLQYRAVHRMVFLCGIFLIFLKMAQMEPEQFQLTNTNPAEGQFIISVTQRFTCSQDVDPLQAACL